jgi:hypothetical protein
VSTRKVLVVEAPAARVSLKVPRLTASEVLPRAAKKTCWSAA